MISWVSENREKLRITCDRCGFEKTINSRQIYRNADTSLCQSCKAEPATRVMRGRVSCRPHRGEVDLNTMAPLDNFGNLYLPGHRICGMADCVRRDHIAGSLEYKRGRAIFRGQVITYENFLAMEAERKATK
jgi:hypothetical protein